jgi:hypothetical protein
MYANKPKSTFLLIGLGILGFMFFSTMGCDQLKQAFNNEDSFENELLKCSLKADEQGITLTNPKAINYTWKCEAKTETPVVLSNIQAAYLVQVPKPGNRATYTTKAVGTNNPFGDKKVSISKDKPFNYEGTIESAELLPRSATRKSVQISAVFNEDTPDASDSIDPADSQAFFDALNSEFEAEMESQKTNKLLLMSSF